jgi:type IV secretion system protein VirB11
MKPADRSLSVRLMLDKYGIAEALSGDITEFAINEPGGFWTEDSKGWRYHESGLLTFGNLEGLATTIGVFNKKTLDVDNPIASMTLPQGERCQIVMPPVCEQSKISMTIRNPSSSRFSLEDYERSGRLAPALSLKQDTIFEWEMELLELSRAGRFMEFFRKAVEHKLNIVTVGGTGSGKTTFSKTLIDMYPTDRRIFTIEDAHELTELRGDETWDYMMALKSGHSGSVTSVHANDCRGARYKIGSYIKQSEVGKGLDMSLIMREVETTIDVVVYFEKTYLKELYYDPVNKLKLLRGE